MTAEPGGALVHLTVSEPLPIEAAAGGDIVLRARASCRQGTDRGGLAITVIAPDGASTAHVLSAHRDGIGETAPIALKAPPRVGDHAFRLVLPPHEIAGTHYREATLDVPVRVKPQATSLAVWGVPSPVVAGTRFTVQVGAKSTTDCTLARRAVEICDATGAAVARSTLGDRPLAGTAALYWTAVELTAPERDGVAHWSVRFEASELDLPHEDAATDFSVAVVPPPEHKLQVKVVEQATAAPIADVELRLVESRLVESRLVEPKVGAYRGTTGPAGLAEIALPKGRYELHVWKVGYDAPPRPVEVGADAFVEVEALPVPEENPDARWKM